MPRLPMLSAHHCRVPARDAGPAPVPAPAAGAWRVMVTAGSGSFWFLPGVFNSVPEYAAAMAAFRFEGGAVRLDAVPLSLVLPAPAPEPAPVPPAPAAAPVVDPALALARPVLARLPSLAASRDLAGAASALISLRGLISLMPEPVLFAFADEMLPVLAASRAFVDSAWDWAAASLAADVAAGAAARAGLPASAPAG